MVVGQLSLPADIPWKRMSFSKDMIDTKGNDLKIPYKWRSSISVFYHEPSEVPTEYSNRKITYLKIVCTITSAKAEDSSTSVEDDGYSDEISVLRKLKGKYQEFFGGKETDNPIVWNSILDTEHPLYPCYGALLHVGIFPQGTPPGGGDIKLHDYPYIASFEPRKREMYEVISQSGEVASQSANRINLLKGTTNTESTEDHDMDLGGGSFAGNVEMGFMGGTFATGLAVTEDQKQEGQIRRSQSEKQDITTTDASREKRESHSYSTNINQLYTLLQSYHLGTNRALFFMQPRPHIRDAVFTFIQGLRRLEGIQEFFFIINRPSWQPGICVEAALETAHLKSERAYRAKAIPEHMLYDPGNLEKTAEALGLNTSNMEVDTSPYYHIKLLVDTWKEADIDVRAVAFGKDPDTQRPPGVGVDEWPLLLELVRLVPEIGTEPAAMIFEEYEKNAGTFFVTGRRSYACTVRTVHELSDQGEISGTENTSTVDASPSIVYEKTYRPMSSVKNNSMKQINGAFDANAMIQDLNEELWTSIGSVERHPYGEISFMEADFVLDELAQPIRILSRAGAPNQLLDKIGKIAPYVDRGLGKTSECKRVFDVGTVTTQMISNDLGISEIEARKIRKDLIYSVLESIDPKSLRKNAKRENLIEERFNFRYSKERLNKLLRSARVTSNVKRSGKLANNGKRNILRQTKSRKKRRER